MKLIMINGKIYKSGSNIRKIEQAKKLKRFIELCSQSIKASDLKIGFICYDGYSKYEIISEPYINENTKTPFISCNRIYDKEHISYDDIISLADHNIIGGGYNLERIFKSEQKAIEYKSLRKDYEYRGFNSHGDYGLLYTITPIPGEPFNPKKHIFKQEQK